AAESVLDGAESDAERDEWLQMLVDAYRGAGDMEVWRGDFEQAEAFYRRIPDERPAMARSRADALSDLELERARARLYRISFAVIAAIALFFMLSLRRAALSWREAWRALRSPPGEVLFMAPIAIVLIAASLTGHLSVAPAVVIICVGGLALTWLSGAGLTAAQHGGSGIGRRRLFAHLVALMLAVVALCYAALHHNRLIDVIITTVEFGPES
ncbi:MAG: hypothetical protein AAGC55_29600, partial [Myxococcota bacterium]